MKFSLAVATTLLLPTLALAHSLNSKIVYGDDDRLDLRDVKDARLVKIAEATAAMIPQERLSVFTDPTSGADALMALTLEGRKGVCESEAFAAQPALGSCTGFLVGPKTLVTAGHCVDEVMGCGNKVWAFGYAITQAGEVSPPAAALETYTCAKVLKAVSVEATGLDYAVVELDREVAGRTPLKFRRSGKVATGTPLIVVGYPSGLPVKVAGGAQVMEQKQTYFAGNLDTFGGNSGSPVLNGRTLEVEGILVRGDEDYTGSPMGCQVVNRIEKPAASEQSTRITLVREIQKKKKRFWIF